MKRHRRLAAWHGVALYGRVAKRSGGIDIVSKRRAVAWPGAKIIIGMVAEHRAHLETAYLNEKLIKSICWRIGRHGVAT